MSSKMIIRSCGTSIRKLINRHLSTAVAATSIKTKTPVSVYSWCYFQPKSLVHQSTNCGCGFCSKAAGGYSAETGTITRGRPEFEAENNLNDDGDDDDDDSEVEFDEDDDSDYDDEDDDDLDIDDH